MILSNIKYIAIAASLIGFNLCIKATEAKASSLSVDLAESRASLPTLQPSSAIATSRYSFQSVIDNIVANNGMSLLERMGNQGKPNANGLVGTNIPTWQSPRFQYRAGTYLWANVGLGNTNRIGDALRAIETAYSRQKADGSLSNPAVSSVAENLSSHSFFLSETAYGLLILSQSPYKSQFQSRLNTLLPKVNKLATWLANHPKWTELNLDKNDGKFANRALFNGSSLYFSGLLFNKTDLINSGMALIDRAISKQDSEGWYLEKGNYNLQGQLIAPIDGGDSSYQGVSLMRMFEIATQSQNVAHQNSFELGWAWERSKINTQGVVSTQGNTRVPNEGKEIGYSDIIASALMTGGIFDDSSLVNLAQLMTDRATLSSRTAVRQAVINSSVSSTSLTQAAPAQSVPEPNTITSLIVMGLGLVALSANRKS